MQPMPAFCLPADYSPHDRPEFEGVQRVYAGFLIDDVSSIDDVSCEVTLVLVMKFQWVEPRLVRSQAVCMKCQISLGCEPKPK